MKLWYKTDWPQPTQCEYCPSEYTVLGEIGQAFIPFCLDQSPNESCSRKSVTSGEAPSVAEADCDKAGSWSYVYPMLSTAGWQLLPRSRSGRHISLSTTVYPLGCLYPLLHICSGGITSRIPVGLFQKREISGQLLDPRGITSVSWWIVAGPTQPFDVVGLTGPKLWWAVQAAWLLIVLCSGWPNVPVCTGLRGFPWCRTFSAKIKKPGKAWTNGDVLAIPPTVRHSISRRTLSVC